VSTTFAELGVPRDLVRALTDAGFTAPFPVQAATVPDLLAGRDVCGRAPTGSGKTLAFGVPLVATVTKASPRRPRALVLAPTRELAAQIELELRPLAQVRHRRVTAIYGGVGYEPQRRALRRGVDIVVACPGRLTDLLDQGALSLGDVEVVVIDEADRMADMGFFPQVRRLLAQTPASRQTVLFSATLDGDVATLTRDHQLDPVRHEVGRSEPDLTLMEHGFEVMDPGHRIERTAVIVGQHGPTVVFCRSRHIVDRVVRQLGRTGVESAAIHGGRSQGQRTRALEAFRRGDVQALVATDIAARGIHVDGVACVVHYDMPGDAKTYVHRSGRTGRAGASGVVVTLVAPPQQKEARRLRRDVGLEDDLVGVGTERSGPLPAGTAKSVPAGRSRGRHGRETTSAGRRRRGGAGAGRSSR
jgi:superfamily II DNA/RNA helicase